MIMIWGWIVSGALVLLVPSTVVFLLAKKRWPRVSAFASGVMSATLGVLLLWVAVEGIQRGAYEPVPSSRYFPFGASREASPVMFWTMVSVCALLGLVLVIGGLVDGSRVVRNTWKDRSR